MAEVKWIKLTTDMFDNRKIRHLRKLPEGNNIVLIWVMLLTMAGKCNAGGMIFLTENIPYNSKLLAEEVDFEERVVELALKALHELGMIETDGDYFTISNWKEHQNVEGMERIREQNRIRKQNQRAKQKLAIEESHVTSRDSHATDIDIDKDIDIEKDNTVSIDTVRSTKVQPVIEEWNKLNLQKVISVNAGTTRNTLLNARLKEYGLEKVMEAIRSIDKSSYLKGQNKNGWTVTFDWFLKPNNFIKVLEGNYLDKGREVEQDGEDRKGETTDQYYARKYGIFQSNGSK